MAVVTGNRTCHSETGSAGAKLASSPGLSRDITGGRRYATALIQNLSCAVRMFPFASKYLDCHSSGVLERDWSAAA